MGDDLHNDYRVANSSAWLLFGLCCPCQDIKRSVCLCVCVCVEHSSPDWLAWQSAC